MNTYMHTYINTVLPQIMAWMVISFQQLLSRLLNGTGDYMRPVFIIRSSESTFFGATGDAHVADPLDTVHHENLTDSVVFSHHVYKSV